MYQSQSEQEQANIDELNEQVAEALIRTFEGTGAEMVSLIKTNKKYNQMLGTLYGGFLGDALGSFCEFQHNLKSALMNHVMTMPGQGTFNIDAGQLTDDSELALELAKALLTYDVKCSFGEQFDVLIKEIATGYVDWYKSDPFDIGHTCRAAFEGIAALNPGLPAYEYVQEITKVTRTNINSESNGSMMRVAPMAIFSAYLGNHPLKDEFILREIRLTHSSPAILASSLSWINLLEKLMNRTSNNLLLTIIRNFLETYSHKVYSEISTWLTQVKKQEEEQGGWAKVVWGWGIFYLNSLADGSRKINNRTYQQIIKQVIKKGGDTDTNACIVGSVVGSVLGFRRLPPHMILKMINLDLQTSRARTPRPKTYEPKNGFEFLYKMHKKFYI